MYFPTSAARQLCTTPGVPNILDERVSSLVPSPRKTLFCTLTEHGLTVWRVRPTAVLAHLSRTRTSIAEHGTNDKAQWSQDGGRIVIQTSLSFLVLVTVEYDRESVVYETLNTATPSAQRNFQPGAGEGFAMQPVILRFEGVIRVEGGLLSVSPRKHYIMFATRSPPAVQRIPWPAIDDDEEPNSPGQHAPYFGFDSWLLNDEELPWLVDPDVYVWQIIYSRTLGVETWLTSDGRAYFVRLQERFVEIETEGDEEGSQTASSAPLGNAHPSMDSLSSQQHFQWHGTCIHNFETPKWMQKRPEGSTADASPNTPGFGEPRRAVAVAVNARYSLMAIGTHSGSIEYTNFPTQEGVTPASQTLSTPNTYSRQTGPVCALEWSSDGYVLAVGWDKGWAIFSVGGRCLAWGFGSEDTVDEAKFQDAFMNGVSGLFWAPGNFELMVLASRPSPSSGLDISIYSDVIDFLAAPDGQLFVVPFAKSATTGQHTPDNTRYAFLQLDDRALVYRGADQPDMSVINPESDVWQHIKIPAEYLAANWPIRYSSLSSDGRLIAIAGRRGLVHYSSSSGRWKCFADELQEQAFCVKGGLLWFHHVLIATVEVSRTYQIRLYSRDLELSNQNVLHRELISSPVVILSLVDNSLLVYTADNTLYHYLVIPTTDSITLHLCGSISFTGIIASPNSVRVLSWMIPSAQKQIGDPMQDLSVATVLMMVGGQLVLLRPRKSENQEVKYDMQIFANRIEFCWIHLRGIGALENSLWGYDGSSIRIWLNALAIESSAPDELSIDAPSVKESVNIPLDFYPLSVLMDKGIIIGAEHEIATRMTLPFVLFRHATNSQLFLHHILRYQLSLRQVREAVLFASHYQHLVFFAHALEILLHTVVEAEAEFSDALDSEAQQASVLPATIEFLDHFDACLDVVVGCARKTEVTRWPRLFNIVGNPKSLFEVCLQAKRLKTAGSYLLVLHNLEQLDEDNTDSIRLLKEAVETQDWQLCRELLRFLHSIDDSGAALKTALAQTSILQAPQTHIAINGDSVQ